MAIQARTEFASALNQVCSERGLEPEVVIDSIKQAILAAYRKDYGEPEGIVVDLNAETGEVALSKDKKIITPPGFGRIAAQTAKQVILQRIREAEKDAILSEYSSKVGTVVSGLIQRISGPIITVNLGKAEGIMPPAEQAHNENYFVNQRLKLYIVGIKEGARGEEIIVSRSSPSLLEGLFRQEVPEIAQGSVEIKIVAREAGSRTKIAVFSDQMGVDPVGSCVGQKGVRVQAVINELGDEKIDVIAYQEDPVEFIKSALSPAKDLQVVVNEKNKTAEVTAPDDQLSLAIGRDGQNVRLAAKLTGYKIDIRGKSGSPKEVEQKEKKAQEEAKKALGVTEEGTSQEKKKKAAVENLKPPSPTQSAQADDQSPQTEQPQELPAPSKSKETKQLKEKKIAQKKEEKKGTESNQSTVNQTASDLASQNVGESPKSKPSETENSKSATSENTDTPVSQSNESDNSPEDPQDDGDKA